MIIMKKIILLSILIMIIISCTEADRRIWNEANEEYNTRGRKCKYNHKGELIGSCDFIN